MSGSKRRKRAFKLVVLGNSGVGKSCVLSRYCKNSYSSESPTTMGIDQLRKRVQYKDTAYDLEIFDTAGQERFRTITTAYYKSSKAFLMVYDIGDAASFTDIYEWIKQIELYSNNKHVRVLIGNKLDNAAAREIPEEQAREFAKENKCHFFEVSAKTGENVEHLFDEVLRELVDLKKSRGQQQQGKKQTPATPKKPTTSDEQSCCVVS